MPLESHGSTMASNLFIYASNLTYTVSNNTSIHNVCPNLRFRQLLYAAPEVYLDGPNGNISNLKADIWSIGIILAELALDKSLWVSLKLGQRIRKILSLIHSNTPVFERIAHEHNCYEKYQVSISHNYLRTKKKSNI